MITDLARRIEDLLPQTQCTKCGFEGCAPYALAIAQGNADINQCPPGGQEGVARLAHLLERPVSALNPENGVERPRALAVIDESLCIGCTLCMQACPVDAIVGAAKLMHTVIDAACTGCDLCVAPCPVDCIAMLPVTGTATGWAAWSQAQADKARHDHDRRLARLGAKQAAAAQRVAQRIARANADMTVETATDMPEATDPSGMSGMSGVSVASGMPDDPIAATAEARKRAIIAAAVERARSRRITE